MSRAASTLRIAVTLLLILCVSVPGSLPAQERMAVVESVDLAIPFTPTVVRTAGKPVLVYELHVTNFVDVDVTLRRLQVLRPDGTALADYRDEELRKRLGRAGTRGVSERPQVIGQGVRGIVYLWIEVPDASSVPASLRHRLELDIVRPAATVRTTVEGAVSALSSTAPIVLDPPLRGGPWTAIYDPHLAGGHRTAMYTVGGRARIPGRFAIDWIRLPASGTFERDETSRPADRNGNGAEVLAVADGTVAAARDGVPDNTDPAAPEITLANAAGNYVALDLGNGRFAFYEHLLRGSVRVKTGDRVRRGDVIGRLGNSGSSSIGPHLHFHVADANSPLGAEGVPFVFSRFEQLGAFSSINALIEGERWVANPDDATRVRQRERPGPNAVVLFR